MRTRKGGTRHTMANAHSANKLRDRVYVKDIPHHAIRFDLVEAPLMSTSDYTSSVLTAMLQHRESLDYFSRDIDRRVARQ